MIFNCVINLAAGTTVVPAKPARVLRSGGRVTADPDRGPGASPAR